MPPSQPSKLANYIPFNTGHDDLVHDVCYDFYGKRIVTCSSDQRLMIFDLNDDGEWIQSEAWKAHDGSISKVIWGHPEHGHIIASCANDRSVRIWEEQEFELKSSPRRWKRQAIIPLDVAITDISFAPVHHGLKLASISPMGTLYIHEAPEPQDTTVWVTQEQIQILQTPPPREIEVSFVVEYCPSGWGGEQLAVGAMDKVRIYRRSESGKYRAVEELPGHKNMVRGIAWAPTMGRSYHLIATACKDGHVRIFKLTDAKTNTTPKSRKSTSVYRGSSGGGGTGRPSGGLGSLIEKATASAAISGSKNISGSDRGFIGADELLGPGLETKEEEEDDDQEDGMSQYNVQLIADLDDHRREVWRVRWNATGTILISAGDDGKIRLWKATLSGEFKCMSAVSSKKSESGEE